MTGASSKLLAHSFALRCQFAGVSESVERRNVRNVPATAGVPLNSLALRFAAWAAWASLPGAGKPNGNGVTFRSLRTLLNRPHRGTGPDGKGTFANSDPWMVKAAQVLSNGIASDAPGPRHLLAARVDLPSGLHLLDRTIAPVALESLPGGDWEKRESLSGRRRR